MTNFEILRVGVAFNDSTNTDKVWGLGMMEDGHTFRFWGRRSRPCCKAGPQAPHRSAEAA